MSRLVNDGGGASTWTWHSFDGTAGEGAENDAEIPSGQALMAAEREEGFREGLEVGMARAEEHFRTTLDALGAVVSELTSQASARDAAVEERVRLLALAVARLLLDRELRSDPGEVAQFVRRGLAHFPPELPLLVRMNPEDLAVLAHPADRGVVPPPMARGGHLRWEADPGLGRGDVLVEAPERILDGRVTSCLERIWEALSDD